MHGSHMKTPQNARLIRSSQTWEAGGQHHASRLINLHWSRTCMIATCFSVRRPVDIRLRRRWGTFCRRRSLTTPLINYRMNRNIANSAHIETMLISNSYTPTMIMKSLEISEPLSLISHVFGGTWIGVPRRIIITRGICGVGVYTEHFTENGVRGIRSTHRSCSDMSLTPFAVMNLAFGRVVIRTGPLWRFAELNEEELSVSWGHSFPKWPRFPHL